MKKFGSIFICFLVILAAHDAAAQARFQKTASGVRYKILSTTGGTRIELTNIVTFNFIEKTDKDSVLYNSFVNNDPVKVQIQPSSDVLDLMDVFLNLREKDSVIVQVHSDSIYKNREAERPRFLPRGSNLYFTIKIEEVKTLEQALAEESKALETEKALLKKYIGDNNLKPVATASGLLFVSLKPTNGRRPDPGDTVYINYIAGTVDGKIFDSSIEAEARKAGLKQNGRKYEPIGFIVGENNVITAWDEGILMMGEGAWAKFIIPSGLAFGGRSFGKVIKPYTTFIIDVELVRIRKLVTGNGAKPLARTQKTAMAPVPYAPPNHIVNNLTAFLLLLGSSNKNGPVTPKIVSASSPATMPWVNFITRFLFE